MVDAVSDAKRREWLDRMRIYGRRLIWEEFGHSRCSLVGLPHIAVKMAVKIRKWQFPWGSGVFSWELENDFQHPLVNEAWSHFQMFGIFIPYRGTAPLKHRRPTRVVGSAAAVVMSLHPVHFE
jgi:hypothetical protein